MAEQEIKETEGCKHKCSLFHKIFGLKGLSIIFKVISVLVLLYLLYILSYVWYLVFKDKAPVAEALFGSLQFVATYGFYALLMYSLSVILKVLRKIKYAVEHR
jgi:hypothetical protein